MSKKLEVATKVLKEAEVKAAQIEDLETDPSYLCQEDLKKLQTELKQKIRAATRIQDQISDILEDPGYLSTEDLQKMKEKFESVKYPCVNCRQSLPASQVKRCKNNHVCCTKCYPTQITCPYGGACLNRKL